MQGFPNTESLRGSPEDGQGYQPQPTVASILGGGTVLGLVSTFILGRMLKPH